MPRAVLLAIAFAIAVVSGCQSDSGETELPQLARRNENPDDGAFRNLGKRAASSLDASAP